MTARFQPQTAADYGLEIEPSPIVTMRGEAAALSNLPLNTWRSRTKLKKLMVPDDRGVVAQGSLVPGSVCVRCGGKVLIEGKDFVVDEQWGAVSSLPASRLADGAPVEVDYAFALRRLDAWAQRPDGSRYVLPGQPDLTCPIPPSIDAGHVRLANLYVDYHQTRCEAAVYWVLQEARPTTLTTPGRLPIAISKLAAGGSLSIVCWGDSVTGGGDVSRPELAFPRRLEVMLQDRYPAADVQLHTVAVGGSESRNWLEPSVYPHPHDPEACDWQRVVDLTPDVVVVEFVNDDRFPSDETLTMYRTILDRITALGAEPVLLTPHFTAPHWLQFTDGNDLERRQYVFDLLSLSAERQLAIADVSSRWAALWSQGLPYPTLLRNGVNHPDDRGHLIFAEELLLCFQ